jgi:hypothetical protein
LVGVDSYADDVNITIDDVKEALAQRPDLGIRLSDKSVVSDAAAQAYLNNAEVVLGANLIRNEYGHQLFANFFYFITGFHGFHVFSGSSNFNCDIHKCNQRNIRKKRTLRDD